MTVVPSEGQTGGESDPFLNLVITTYDDARVAEEVFWPIADAVSGIDWRKESDPEEDAYRKRGVLHKGVYYNIILQLSHLVGMIESGGSYQSGYVTIEAIEAGQTRDSIFGMYEQHQKDLVDRTPLFNDDDSEPEEPVGASLIAKTAVSYYFDTKGASNIGISRLVENIDDEDEPDFVVSGDGCPMPIETEDDENYIGKTDEDDDEDEIDNEVGPPPNGGHAIFHEEDLVYLGIAARALRVPQALNAVHKMINRDDL